MFEHQRKPSDFSELDKGLPGSSADHQEKSCDRGDGSCAPGSNGDSKGLSPQVDLFGPTSASLNDTGLDWPTWVGRFGPERPPSAVSTATSATNLAGRNLRISVVAPSPASSRNGPFQQGSHSRASSTLSGNHLHPVHAQVQFSQRPASVRSRESLATVAESAGGEPSPVWSHITESFPLPNSSLRPASYGTMATSSTAVDSRGKPFASNNPFRNSVAQSGSPAHRRYSPMSDDGARNPFELELERASLDIDFTKIGLTPIRSGHSTINPTTPITPRVRRKSASSLSLYSEEGAHYMRSNGNNPFDVGPLPIDSMRHIQTASARDSTAEALDLATTTRTNA